MREQQLEVGVTTGGLHNHNLLKSVCTLLATLPGLLGEPDARADAYIREVILPVGVAKGCLDLLAECLFGPCVSNQHYVAASGCCSTIQELLLVIGKSDTVEM